MSRSMLGPRKVQWTDIRADGKNLTSANSGIDSEPNGPVLRATGFCPRMMTICTRRFSSGNISYHSLWYAALHTPSLWNHTLDMSFKNQLIFQKVRSCYINNLIRCLILKIKKKGGRALLEKLVKKFAAFCGIRKFITAFTRARYLSLSWAKSIQSMPHYHTSWRSILIFSHVRLDLPSYLFPSGHPAKFLYAPIPPPIRVTCPSYVICRDLMARIILREDEKML